MFPAVSVDVQFTVVSPKLNTEPDVGKQVTLGCRREASTLSVAVGTVNVTLDVASPGSVLEFIGSAGQSPITGASLSALITNQFIEDQNTNPHFEHLESHRK